MGGCSGGCWGRVGELGVGREVGGWLREPAAKTGETLRPGFICLVIKKSCKNPLGKLS